MDNNAVSLLDKIQKLIDQYTEIKTRHDQLEEQNAELKEENRQLMLQIENVNSTKSSSSNRIQELERQLRALEAQHQELQQTVVSFDTIAGDAIKKIDSLIPGLNSTENK